MVVVVEMMIEMSMMMMIEMSMMMMIGMMMMMIGMMMMIVMTKAAPSGGGLISSFLPNEVNTSTVVTSDGSETLINAAMPIDPWE